MGTTELVQLLGIGAGVGVVGALVFFARRLSNSLDAIWPNCTTKYGLAFEEQKTGNPLTAQRHVRSLTGSVSGVPLRVTSVWELVGRTRRTSTTFHARALEPASARCSIHITRGGTPGPTFHLVRTGNTAFDRVISLRSDAPDFVRALVTPPVQAALLQLSVSPVELSYDNGELCLSYGGQPLRQAELDAPIDVVVALGQARPR